MRNLRGTYVHRGDASRRHTRTKRAALFLSFCGALGMAWDARTGPREAGAEPVVFARGADFQKMRNELDATRGELGVAHKQPERWNKIYNYSTRYRISADLAASIYDIALREGIEPELGFRLVRVESEFKERAKSPVGAIGLTQVMPATANYLQPGITRQQLLDRDTNLRLGFRYLKELIAVYDGDAEEALTAYNRGPGTVARIRRQGGDPANGYAELVLGERGRSPVNLVRHDSADAARAAPPLHELPPTRLPSGM